MGIPEGEERDKGPERITEELMALDFSHLMKGMNLDIQEA